MSTRYNQYLRALKKPFKKLCKLEFLNYDGSVAFALGNDYKRGYGGKRDSRAFLQDGSLNVSLQNGQRRNASITLDNKDDVFLYNVNELWYGDQVRLSMGLVLPDGTDFYLPQGVFYITNPSAEWSSSTRTSTLELADKWVYLDGTLFGRLMQTYQVLEQLNGVNQNIFSAMQAILHASRLNLGQTTTDPAFQIDNVPPVFTAFYNGKTYTNKEGQTFLWTDVPYDVTVGDGGSLADLLLEMNEFLVTWIGYDATGALRVDPSQDDISDAQKPILWDFSTSENGLVRIGQSDLITDVYNDVLIVGEGLSEAEVWGRAINTDPRSDTNVNLIGRKGITERQANYWQADQCRDLAVFKLKRKTVLQKSVNITSQQMFHLEENQLIRVRRTDKKGSPTESHLINSFSLPIGETGEMTINCTSTNEFSDLSITTSSSDTEVM